MEIEISLTVNYKIKIDKEKFWDSETGHPKTDIEERLSQYFPEEIILSTESLTTRNHISYIPLKEGKNCLKCAVCGTALYIPGKEYLAEGLEHCKMMKGIPFCHSCAWELENELDDFISASNNPSD